MEIEEIQQRAKDFIQGLITGNAQNSKDETMEEKETIVENEDKRKLIDEIGGILKGKVDEEIWRTIVGKLEKVAYEPSEDTKADNKCKNEDDEEEKEEKFEEEKEIAENKKCKNEEDKEEEKEEKIEKVENSMDKAREIAMGGNEEYKQTSYVSQKERIELGNNY